MKNRATREKNRLRRAATIGNNKNIVALVTSFLILAFYEAESWSKTKDRSTNSSASHEFHSDRPDNDLRWDAA